MHVALENRDSTHYLRLLKKRPRVGEAFIQGFLFFCGAVSILTTIGIVYELGKESLLFFQMPGVGLFGFLTGTEWQPTIGKFGVLPLVTATLMTTFIAMLVAMPLGLSAAIYLSEYASTARARHPQTHPRGAGRDTRPWSTAILP